MSKGKRCCYFRYFLPCLVLHSPPPPMSGSGSELLSLFTARLLRKSSSIVSSSTRLMNLAKSALMSLTVLSSTEICQAVALAAAVFLCCWLPVQPPPRDRSCQFPVFAVGVAGCSAGVVESFWFCVCLFDLTAIAFWRCLLQLCLLHTLLRLRHSSRL